MSGTRLKVMETLPKPPIVTPEEWQRDREELLAAEKDATRALDALAARRRRLPMVRFRTDYEFQGPGGPKNLVDLFEGHRQLAVYQFMDVGPDHFCPGCTNFTNNVPERMLGGIAEHYDIAWATVSDMPLEQIERYKKEKGWTLPFYSSHGTTFSADCGAPAFMLSMFLREGDEVYRTYSTTGRGVDRMLFPSNIADLAIYGRQESWEDSPEGWPQHPTYE